MDFSPEQIAFSLIKFNSNGASNSISMPVETTPTKAWANLDLAGYAAKLVCL
jgi:hypothetical protein